MHDEPLHVSIHGDSIILEGRLKNSPETVNTLKQGLNLPTYRRSSTFTIFADNLRIAREGEKAWMCAVRKYLRKCRLVYAPSQLSMLIEFDDDYDHQNSIFEDSNDTHGEVFAEALEIVA